MMVVLGMTVTLAACGNNQDIQSEEADYEEENCQEPDDVESDSQKTEIAEEIIQMEEVQTVINEQGMSLAERIQTPVGYTRTETEAGSLAAFFLAQGYMPAQEFHVLKNENHEDDPWYYADEIQYPFRTPEYTFAEGELNI